MNNSPTGAGPYTVPPSLPDQPLSTGNLANFDVWRAKPPGALYITRDDVIWFRVVQPVATSRWHVFGRVLMLDGEVHLIDSVLNDVTVGSFITLQIPFAEGFLLDLMVRKEGTGVQRGQEFCQAGVGRFDGAVLRPYATLISGYTMGTQGLGWPFGVQDDSVKGPGRIVNNLITVPGAGAEFVYTVAASRRQRIQALIFTLVTAVAVAVRGVRVVVDDSVNVIAQVPANITQAASLTQLYNVGAYPTNPAAIAGEEFVPLPPGLVLQSGFRIRSLTNNIQPADQYSALFVLVEEWWDNI